MSDIKNITDIKGIKDVADILTIASTKGNAIFFTVCSLIVPIWIGTLNKIEEQIAEYSSNISTPTKDTSKLYNINLQKQMYDNKFVEEQYNYQKIPKKRGQTLQEFVLLFFYISLAIFSIALIIYAFLENGQSYTAAAQVFFLCILMTIAITAILIRVA